MCAQPRNSRSPTSNMGAGSPTQIVNLLQTQCQIAIFFIKVRELKKKVIRPPCTLTSLDKKPSGMEEKNPSFCSCLRVTSLGGESVSVTPGLLLLRGLFSPLDVALLEATVDTDRQIVRDLWERYDVGTGSEGYECAAGEDLHRWLVQRPPEHRHLRESHRRHQLGDRRLFKKRG